MRERIVNGFHNLVDRIFSYLDTAWQEFKADVFAFPDELAEAVRKSLGFVEDVIAPGFRGPSPATVEANRALQSQLTAANLAPRTIGQGGANVTNNVTINTLPGQSPQAIGDAVLQKIGGTSTAAVTQRLGK